MQKSYKNLSAEDRRLGMDRAITRRDFLQGVALGAAGMALGCRNKIGQTQTPIHELTGLHGQDVVAMQLGHRVRDGEFLHLPANRIDTGEEYDLVMIGAGLAGLAAAYVYHREKKGRCRILILDNHDDFGGHARRNTFHHQDVTLIAQGGTFALEDPEKSPPEAVEIFNELGIDPDRMAEYRDHNFMKRFGLSSGVFFDPKFYPGATPKWVNRFYEIPYEKQIRQELQKLFGPWGFDPAKDILAITINRWGHGYNFFHLPGEELKTPYEQGRMKLGRISFAGADAGGGPWTQLALQQGRRAAMEQL